MISIFWADKHKYRLSARIRGNEIAERLGVKLNPKDGYENDTRIYIKPNSLDYVLRDSWVDVLDGGKFVKKIAKRPDLKLIACTQHSYDVLKKMLPNKIVLIPHHHLNFERYVRDRKSIDTCGYIGSPSSLAYKMYGKIGKEIRKSGMKFVAKFKLNKREVAVNFYRKIDILVIGAWELGDRHPHKIPTKIINAASFGIPTVAYPLNGYKEIEGHYIRAGNMREMIDGINRLRNKHYYCQWPQELIKMAEPYHIDNVVKLYKNL